MQFQCPISTTKDSRVSCTFIMFSAELKRSKLHLHCWLFRLNQPHVSQSHNWKKTADRSRERVKWMENRVKKKVAQHRVWKCDFSHLPLYLWELQSCELMRGLTPIIEGKLATSSLQSYVVFPFLHLLPDSVRMKNEEEEGNWFKPDRRTFFTGRAKLSDIFKSFE